MKKWMLDDKYLNKKHDSYVYFILHGYDGYMDAIENPDNKNYKLQWDEKSYVKVGISKDPQKRLTAIQLSSPINLTCLGYIPANEDIEKKIHRCLKKHHSRGEWFKYNGSVHEYIDSLYLLDYKGQPQPSYYDKKYPSSNPLDSPEHSAGGGREPHLAVALQVWVLGFSLATKELM